MQILPASPVTVTSAPQVTPQELRRACGQFATGVTVVTVAGDDGPRGMTANSFTSVSLEPPMVLVAVARGNRTHHMIERAGWFAVSVLAQEQRAWADRFAGRHGDRQSSFEDVPHRLTAEGVPVLDGALASLVCRLVAVHAAGDHSLFVGEVASLDCQPGGAPLLFFGGAYATTASLMT